MKPLFQTRENGLFKSLTDKHPKQDSNLHTLSYFFLFSISLIDYIILLHLVIGNCISHTF